MSSILKAIRKVEEEKRVASHTAPDLRSDQGATVHVKKSVGPLLLGMMLGAVCVGLFLYATSSEEEVIKTRPNPPEEKNIVSTPEPVPAKPVVETIPVVTLPPEPVGVAPATNTVKKTIVVVPKKPQTTSPVSVQSKASKLPAHIKLDVTEIFYQLDPANSMAVVNDLPVMPGTAVEGALVQEIRPDRVVFKIDGKVYSVSPAN